MLIRLENTVLVHCGLSLPLDIPHPLTQFSRVVWVHLVQSKGLECDHTAVSSNTGKVRLICTELPKIPAENTQSFVLNQDWFFFFYVHKAGVHSTVHHTVSLSLLIVDTSCSLSAPLKWQNTFPLISVESCLKTLHHFLMDGIREWLRL